MKIHRCLVTGKENRCYQVSFTIEKQETFYPVLANYYPHDIKIVSSEIGFTRREVQILAGYARVETEEWEKKNLV